MMRLRMLGLALVAVFAMSAVAASGASAGTGPHWWVNGAVLPATSKKPITFTSTATKLITKAATITCKKDKGTGEILGGSPGTDKAKIEFEECTTEVLGQKCNVSNEGNKVATTILVNVNTELVFFTKVAGETSKPPLGILFKTIAAKEKTFVKLVFSGIYALDNGPVTATGEEHGPGVAGIAGVVCKITEPAETETVSHEIDCVEKEQTKFFYNEGGVLKEGKAGLEFNGEKAEQVGDATIQLVSGEMFSARGA